MIRVSVPLSLASRYLQGMNSLYKPFLTVPIDIKPAGAEPTEIKPKDRARTVNSKRRELLLALFDIVVLLLILNILSVPVS